MGSHDNPLFIYLSINLYVYKKWTLTINNIQQIILCSEVNKYYKKAMIDPLAWKKTFIIDINVHQELRILDLAHLQIYNFQYIYPHNQFYYLGNHTISWPAAYEKLICTSISFLL